MWIEFINALNYCDEAYGSFIITNENTRAINKKFSKKNSKKFQKNFYEKFRENFTKKYIIV